MLDFSPDGDKALTQVNEQPQGDPLDEGTMAITLPGATLQVPVAGGKVVGRPAGISLWIPLAQLVVDPAYTTRSTWGTELDHQQDDEYLRLRRSIEATDGNLTALVIEPTGKTVSVGDSMEPEYRVREGVRRYYALKDLGKPEALVEIIPAGTKRPDRYLLGLIRNDVHQQLSVVDVAITIHLLIDTYHLTQELIARRTGLSQSHISRLNTAATQSPRIKTYLNASKISLDHIEALTAGDARNLTTEQRDLLAWFVVQNELSANAVRKKAKLLTIPDEAGGPEIMLEVTPDGKHVVERQVNVALVPSTKRPPAIQHVWDRVPPYVASPVRLLNNSQPTIALEDTGEALEVIVDSVDAIAYMAGIAQRHLRTISYEELEEALYAGIDALHLAYREANPQRLTPTQPIIDERTPRRA
jgi:ParB-like chromosome segregation protein Spo0J